MPPSKARERIEFRAAIVVRCFPLGGNPALLLELVQSGIERAVANLQHVPGDLFETLADGETVEGLERKNFQEQHIQRPLDQIGRFAHVIASVTERTLHLFPSVSKGSR